MDAASAVGLRSALLLGAAALVASMTVLAAPPINTLVGSTGGGRSDTAIQGYDTVAYFTEGRPVKGQDAYVADYLGVKWKFASRAHRELFEASPEKYAPQYGGYCAYGVAQGHLVAIEPDKFRLIDGKLYLNYSADVQRQWLQDPAGFIKQANASFPRLLKQLP